MTPTQRKLARHALGLPNKQRRTYRNHYLGAHKAAEPDWDALVAAGMATSRPFNTCDTMYHLTRAGAVLALEGGEKLDKEDFPV